MHPLLPFPKGCKLLAAVAVADYMSVGSNVSSLGIITLHCALVAIKPDQGSHMLIFIDGLS